MTTRICPNCRVKLGGYDRFFCTTCGALLPADLINRDGIFSRIANFSVETKPSSKILNNLKKIDWRYVVLPLAGAFLIMFVIVFLGNKYDSWTEKNITSGKNIVQNVNQVFLRNTVETTLAWGTGVFGSDRILEFVPFDVDVVVEGNSISDFANAYVKIDPEYADLQEYLKDNILEHYVFFAKNINGNYAWSLIVFPKKQDFGISSETVKKYSWLKFWRNDPITLITPQESVLTEVADARGKTGKNFTQTTVYALARSNEIKNGKMAIYVLNDTAASYLKSLVGLKGLLPELKTMLESVSKLNSNHVTIL